MEYKKKKKKEKVLSILLFRFSSSSLRTREFCMKLDLWYRFILKSETLFD